MQAATLESPTLDSEQTAEHARIVGRYELHGEIASGGMATVHLGRLRSEVGFRRTVAIKRLLPVLAADPEFRAMLLEEARLAGRIQHPNVVHVIDVVDSAPDLLLVMEYVAGESLARLLGRARQQGELLPPPIAVAIAMNLLDGLHAAHEATDERGEPLDIVHRDVSPQNLMVGADGIARVLDFGIAKATGSSAVTREGQIKGKLAYMAPEQIEGNATRQSDVYAAGVLLWEALTARRLFEGETDQQTLSRILAGRVPKPSEFGAPQALDACVMQALEKDPYRRFPSARSMTIELGRHIRPADPHEVAAWLEELMGEDLASQAARVVEVENAPALIALTTQAQATADAPKGRAGKARWALGLGAITALGAVGIVTRFSLLTKVPEPTATSPARSEPNVQVPTATASATTMLAATGTVTAATTTSGRTKTGLPKTLSAPSARAAPSASTRPPFL
jgi:eukaryotic-like serine/threonine-protein kinase